MHKNDPNFVAWADGVAEIIVGVEADPVGYPASLALGPAAGGIYDVANLGRGGSITLTFSSGIADLPGYDFAVFENSFDGIFLELGWVEVSSDGENFFRFRSHSMTPSPDEDHVTDSNDVEDLIGVNATNITGLAGKYITGYGTPFDLAELRDFSPLLDVDDVNFIRILDIVGDGNSPDTNGKPIYDPYPTIGTAGFDLDAIGVINVILDDPGQDEIIEPNDLDEDGVIDPNELAIFAEAWLSSPDDDNWDSRCNIADPANEFIDMQDFAIISRKWFIDLLTE
jgi:hypothetical protein